MPERHVGVIVSAERPAEVPDIVAEALEVEQVLHGVKMVRAAPLAADLCVDEVAHASDRDVLLPAVRWRGGVGWSGASRARGGS